ncbi:MAG: UMP kinase [Candidatus Latescibacteria bacterium]|nr:UMP kinase [Candidatus Latescibacterota bacterium]
MADFQRILLKLSGEALAGSQGRGLDEAALEMICRQVADVCNLGVEVALVVGGGNIFRGHTASSPGGMDRVTADQMGMLATMINGLAVMDTLERMGVPATVLSARRVDELIAPFDRGAAVSLLEQGRVVIFVGGTGNPYFSTDSASSLRAAQIDADVILKGTKVDGVYDDDPVKNPSAVKFDALTFDEALKRDLRVMDATAFAMCRDNNIPIIVFNLTKSGTLVRVVNGESPGTIVKGE